MCSTPCLRSSPATALVAMAVDNHYFIICGLVTILVHTEIPQVGGESSLGKKYVGKTNSIFFCQTKNRILNAEMG